MLAKTLGIDVKALDHLPKEELFIFQTEPPPPLQTDAVPDPLGAVLLDMVFRLTQQPPTEAPGGKVRIADTRKFPISTDVAAALIEVNPGHMREIHWHPNADEWQYYISAKARMTVFADWAFAGDQQPILASIRRFVSSFIT